MRSTKRFASLFLAMVLLCAVFAGCGGNNTAGNSTTGDDSEVIDDGRVWPVETDNPKVTLHQSTPPDGFPVTAVPDTLTIAQGGEPKTLFPLDGNEIPVMIACRPLYETLLLYNEFTGEFEGLLAERWEFIDDKTVRLYLRQGVKCHAGYEMTAEDVIWTAKVGAENPISTFLWSVFDLDNCKVDVSASAGDG